MKKKQISPRKTPKQERSLMMTETIIEATARILAKGGYESLTTNKVALKAGISIGSLYQYYPNKDSLVVAVALKMMEEDSLIFKHLNTMPPGPQLKKALQELFSIFLDLHAKDWRLRSEIYALVFRIGVTEEVLTLRKNLVSLFSEIIRKNQPALSNDDVEVKSFIFFHSCLGVMQGLSQNSELVNQKLLEFHLFKIAENLIF